MRRAIVLFKGGFHLNWSEIGRSLKKGLKCLKNVLKSHQTVETPQGHCRLVTNWLVSVH